MIASSFPAIALVATLALAAGPAAADPPGTYQGTHLLYQDIAIPTPPANGAPDQPVIIGRISNLKTPDTTVDLPAPPKLATPPAAPGPKLGTDSPAPPSSSSARGPGSYKSTDQGQIFVPAPRAPKNPRAK